MLRSPRRSGQPPTPAAGTAVSSGVRDAIEKLLIKLNRTRFAASDERSMTIVAARGALKVFEQMILRARPAPVASLLRDIQYVSQQHFSRAPAFRLLLANVTRMVLRVVRDAAATGPAGDTMAQSIGDDLSALDTEPTSPRAGGSQPGGGLFPRVDTDQYVESAHGHPSDASGGDREHSNASFVDANMPPTPATEATIPRIPTFLRVERYEEVLNYAGFQDKVVLGIGELLDNFERMTDSLCDYAEQHVAPGEAILTFGVSHTTMRFLRRVAESRPFRLFIMEAEPHGNAQRLRDCLAPLGVTVEIIPDSACYNVMPRVTKVLLSTEGVLANGGLLAPTGTLMVCLAASYFSVNVVVICTTLKISPYYPSDTACTSLVKMSRTDAKEMMWTTFSQPTKVLPPEHTHSVSPNAEAPLVFNPVVEYVAPEYVSLFVTDDGEFTTAYIHRFLREQYHIEDTHI